MNQSIVHRALVTYSNERTGEIRVKIPAVTGQSEVTLTKIGRHPFNSIWVVPAIGEQIIVSADDHLMTNVFWVKSDGYVHTKHYRNYFEAYDLADHAATVNGSGVGVAAVATYTDVLFSEGISLVDNSKITFSYEGVYNLQYSVQWLNTDSQAHDSVVWIIYNGTPFPNSSTYTSVPSKHGSVNGTAVTSINFVGKAFANDYVQLGWAANSASVSMHTINTGDIGTLPATVPTAPGVIVTVTQVA